MQKLWRQGRNEDSRVKTEKTTGKVFTASDFLKFPAVFAIMKSDA